MLRVFDFMMGGIAGSVLTWALMTRGIAWGEFFAGVATVIAAFWVWNSVDEHCSRRRIQKFQEQHHLLRQGWKSHG